ncbi:MAG: hypothetical protein KatS3mg088_637 [Patescibacteria group bacterium]|nr:MAG: hypothetical protein KatS3mg088_637 [Patescibacteria group bacterium]
MRMDNGYGKIIQNSKLKIKSYITFKILTLISKN